MGVKRCSDDTMHIFIDGEDMGPAANAVAKVRFTSSNAHMYFLNMCSVLVFSPFSECVCSAGPVWEDNSRVHRQLLLDGGRGECEGDVAVLRELQ